MKVKWTLNPEMVNLHGEWNELQDGKYLTLPVNHSEKTMQQVDYSYDVSSIISKEIFDYEAPYPVPYEWITLDGEAMSKSHEYFSARNNG